MTNKLLLILQLLMVTWSCFTRAQDDDALRAELVGYQYTMLQKLSKCEVKAAWLYWSLIILLLLQFYVKSNYSDFNWSKNVIFGNFRDSKHWNLVNWGLESWSNLLKSKLRTSKIAKNDILDCLNLLKFSFT